MTARPPHMDLMLTGRNAPAKNITRAGLVTGTRAAKPNHAQKMQARDGIET